MGASTMIWILSALILGVGLGILSFYHSEIAYFSVISVMILFVNMSSSVIELSPEMVPKPGVPAEAVIAGEGGVSEVGLLILIYRFVDHMGLLPWYVQFSIILFTLSFVAGRVSIWAHTHFKDAPETIETEENRKKRILEEYGYKDELPY